MSSRLMALLISGASVFVAFFMVSLLASALRWSDPFAIYGVPALIGTLVYVALAGRRRETKLADAETGWMLDTAIPSGCARLILRREGFNAKLVGIDFFIEGVLVVQLLTPRYTVLDVAPGPHVVVAQGVTSKPAEVRITLPVGRVTIVRLRMKLGRMELRSEEDTPELRARLASTPRVAALTSSSAPV